MNKKILEILEFYADPENYAFNTDSHAKHDFLIMEDRGLRARGLIEELKLTEIEK